LLLPYSLSCVEVICTHLSRGPKRGWISARRLISFIREPQNGAVKLSFTHFTPPTASTTSEEYSGSLSLRESIPPLLRAHQGLLLRLPSRSHVRRSGAVWSMAKVLHAYPWHIYTCVRVQEYIL